MVSFILPQLISFRFSSKQKSPELGARLGGEEFKNFLKAPLAQKYKIIEGERAPIFRSQFSIHKGLWTTKKGFVKKNFQKFLKKPTHPPPYSRIS